MVKPVRSEILDHSEQAQNLLESVLREDDDDTTPADIISVEEALKERPIMQYDTGREKTRILFVTNDTTFLNPTDDSLERFFTLINYFDEMHIMVLRSGTVPTKPVLRVRDNIWVYIASAENWWWTPVVANEVVAEKQLMFAGGFRPDLIVALEPFESGLAAQMIGKRFNRPVQIHVRTDFTKRRFSKVSSRDKWRRMIARYVLKRATSVRAQTGRIKNNIKKYCPNVVDIKVLPRFNNFKSITEVEPEFDVHDKYKMYNKILLYMGALDKDSTLYQAIDVLKYVLANPRVGLIVVGDGVSQNDCVKKIQKLGLETQTVFLKSIIEPATYLKTADVLVVTDKHTQADEIALQGAVAGIPAIMTHTETREEYFTDEKNAFLCPDNEDKFLEKLRTLVHNLDVRAKFKGNLATQVVPRLAADSEVYQVLYRNSVEMVFLESDAGVGEQDEEGNSNVE